jgi:hypothetical protein
MSAGLALDSSVFGNVGNGHRTNGHGHQTSASFDLNSLSMSLHKVTSTTSTVGMITGDDDEEVLGYVSITSHHT